MNPIVAGMLVDVAAFAVLGIALAVGVPWEKVSPFLYILLGAKAANHAARALNASPPTPPANSGQTPRHESQGQPGGTLQRLALASGVVALFVAVPMLIASRARS